MDGQILPIQSLLRPHRSLIVRGHVQALADIVSDVLGTSRWLDSSDSGQKALPPLKEYPVPKAFCEVRCFVFREHLHRKQMGAAVQQGAAAAKTEGSTACIMWPYVLKS